MCRMTSIFNSYYGILCFCLQIAFQKVVHNCPEQLFTFFQVAIFEQVQNWKKDMENWRFRKNYWKVISRKISVSSWDPLPFRFRCVSFPPVGYWASFVKFTQPFDQFWYSYPGPPFSTIRCIIIIDYYNVICFMVIYIYLSVYATHTYDLGVQCPAGRHRHHAFTAWVVTECCQCARGKSCGVAAALAKNVVSGTMGPTVCAWAGGWP